MSEANLKQKGNSMIARVIEMLGEEKDKIKANLAEEEATMAEYMQWCDDTQTELSYGIKSTTAKIEDLTATITDNTAQIAALEEELTELGNEIAERTSEMEESIAIREKEHSEFLKAETEQVALVEQLEDMGVALKKQISAFTATPPPVAEEALLQKASPAATFDAFLQINAKTKDDVAIQQDKFDKLKTALTMVVNTLWASDAQTRKQLNSLEQSGAFVQEEPAEGGDAMAAQVGQNEKNLAAFEGLKGKAEEALQKQRDEENKKQSEHDIQVMSLKQAIALAENNVDDAKKERARLAQEKGSAEEEKVDCEASLAADGKSLKETTHECEATAEAWATRQSEAKAEVAAIEKAKEILASRVTVLIQVKITDKMPEDPTQTANAQKTRSALINHFRNLGNKIHSLAMLNLVTVAAQDPMENVKNLLNELIAKLEKEAKEAADLHAFCQAEKKKTKAALDKKNMEIDKLDSRIDKASATKQEQEELIAANSEEIAATEKANAEATKLRNEQHTNFVKVDTDFTAAAEAVDDAIDALKEYYGDAALLQIHAKRDSTSDNAPPTFGGAKKDSAGGIMSILETMGEEFRKTVKENSATEREQLKAFETLMNDNKVLISTREAEIKGAESQIKSLDVSLKDGGEDMKMVTKEKGAILDYVAKLKPQCEGRVVPYEERKAKRDAEIAGLKEGLAILEEESPSGAFASFLQIQKHIA
jgi:predicted  nucleic acid-binding Zn-ribbon protein